MFHPLLKAPGQAHFARFIGLFCAALFACSDDPDSENETSSFVTSSTASDSFSSTSSGEETSTTLVSSSTSSAETSSSDESSMTLTPKFENLVIAQPYELCAFGPYGFKWEADSSHVPIFRETGRFRVGAGTFRIADGIGPSLEYVYPDGRTVSFAQTELTATAETSSLPEVYEDEASFLIAATADTIRYRVAISIRMLAGESEYRVDKFYPQAPLSHTMADSTVQSGGFLTNDPELPAGDPNFLYQSDPYGWCEVEADQIIYPFEGGKTLTLTVRNDWMPSPDDLAVTYHRLLAVEGEWPGGEIHETRPDHLAAGGQMVVTNTVQNPLDPMWYAVKFDEPVGDVCGLFFSVGFSNFTGEEPDWVWSADGGTISCDDHSYTVLTKEGIYPPRLSEYPWED